MADAFNITKAIELARLEAGRNPNKPKYCARYTTNAIEAGLPQGTNKAERPNSAYQFGTVVREYGFEPIDSPDIFKKGDVVIIDRHDAEFVGPWRDPNKAVKSIPHGHMAIYDGEQWISDFKQRKLYPGSAYETLRPGYQVYRHPGAFEEQKGSNETTSNPAQ